MGNDCIDPLNRIADDNKTDRVVKQLDEAFSTVGFVYLTNHGIQQATVKLFDPPLPRKMSSIFFDLETD